MRGSGKVLVLLHGFLESLEMWKSIESQLSASHQVISIDLLGHGKTDCLGYIHPMELMAEQVIHVMEQHDVERAKFIGHSMGGYVALAIAHLRPDLIEGICLMNSTFEADSKERRIIRQRAIEMAKTDYEQLVRLTFSNLFAAESRINYKEDYGQALTHALQTPVQGYVAAQKGMQDRKNHLQTFLNIRGPKAMVFGKKDTVITASAIKKSIEQTEVALCELSGGHMSHIEDLYELSLFLNLFIEL